MNLRNFDIRCPLLRSVAGKIRQKLFALAADKNRKITAKNPIRKCCNDVMPIAKTDNEVNEDSKV
jgi:hypothetical protein